jgi:hypothetical protein
MPIPLIHYLTIKDPGAVSAASSSLPAHLGPTGSSLSGIRQTSFAGPWLSCSCTCSTPLLFCVMLCSLSAQLHHALSCSCYINADMSTQLATL